GGGWVGRRKKKTRNNSGGGSQKPLLLDPVLCELGKVDRRKKSRENREQLRCCNWIRLPTGPIPEVSGVKAGTRQSQEPEYLSGPPHSFPRMRSEKTSSQKEE